MDQWKLEDYKGRVFPQIDKSFSDQSIVLKCYAKVQCTKLSNSIIYKL